MIRLVYVVKKASGVSAETFRQGRRESLGPLVAGLSAKLAIRRYVQHHKIDDPINEALREPRGLMAPYDGAEEYWWDSLDILKSTLKTREGRDALLEIVDQERDFIDFASSSLWLATDVPQINPTPENIVAGERSTLLKLFYVFRVLPTLSREEAQLYWRMNHGPLIRMHAQAAGILRYIQVHAIDDPIAERLREARGGAMNAAYEGHAELWYDRLHAGAQAPERESALMRFYEDEKRFIDFSRSAMWFGKEYVFVDR